MDRQAVANRMSRAIWLKNIAQQTDLRIQAALGNVGDVVQLLMHGALKAVRLEDLADIYFEIKGIDPATCERDYLLVQDLSSGQVSRFSVHQASLHLG